jgi:hypothetical protein
MRPAVRTEAGLGRKLRQHRMMHIGEPYSLGKAVAPLSHSKDLAVIYM